MNELLLLSIVGLFMALTALATHLRCAEVEKAIDLLAEELEIVRDKPGKEE